MNITVFFSTFKIQGVKNPCPDLNPVHKYQQPHKPFWDRSSCDGQGAARWLSGRQEKRPRTRFEWNNLRMWILLDSASISLTITVATGKFINMIIIIPSFITS